MNIPITFSDFTNETKFLVLQNKFAIYDERENPYEPEVYIKVIKEEFFIILKTIDIFTLKDEYIKTYFYKDYLLKEINKLAKRYIDAFRLNLENNLIYEEEKIKLLATQKLNYFVELKELLNKSNYITLVARKKIINQIDIVFDYLSNVHILPTYSLDNKIKFNWNKDDILLLMLMLRDKKIIPHNFDNELGMLLDKSFLYYNKQEKKFKELNKSGKIINDIKNNNKSIKKSLERLKAFFSDESFYDFPYQ
jgi:hypothetical protein